MKFLYKSLLFLMIFICSVGSVCATDTDTNNTDSLTTFEDNNLQLNSNNTILHTSTDVNNLTDNDNSTVINDSSDLSTVPCAVSSYICVMESYNKTVDIETGIKETHTVNNVTSVDGLVNALTNQNLKCNVIKTKSIENLKEIHKDKRIKIIVHMSIDDECHFACIKEMLGDGILFNNDWFLFCDDFKQRYSNLAIIITNDSNLNLSCFGENISKNKWSMITGKLSERELYNSNMGLIGITLKDISEYLKLKKNIKDNYTKQDIAHLENILFGDTLKPKQSNLLTIQKQLKPITNNPNVSDESLKKLNAILTPMQKSLNETIKHLNYLKKEIIHHRNRNNLNAVVSNPKQVIDISKLLDDGCNLFINNLKESINNLNPLNAHPELREELDQEYGLEHHTFGFIDYYTLKKDKKVNKL